MLNIQKINNFVLYISICWCFSIVISTQNTYSLLYNELIKQNNISHNILITSLIGCTLNGMLFIFCLPASYLINKFNQKRIGVIGGFISTINIFLTAYINNIYLFILTYGIILGIGQSFLLISTYSIIEYNFNKNNNLINEIITSSSSIMTIILSILFNYIINYNTIDYNHSQYYSNNQYNNFYYIKQNNISYSLYILSFFYLLTTICCLSFNKNKKLKKHAILSNNIKINNIEMNNIEINNIEINNMSYIDECFDYIKLSQNKNDIENNKIKIVKKNNFISIMKYNISYSKKIKYIFSEKYYLYFTISSCFFIFGNIIPIISINHHYHLLYNILNTEIINIIFSLSACIFTLIIYLFNFKKYLNDKNILIFKICFFLFGIIEIILALISYLCLNKINNTVLFTNTILNKTNFNDIKQDIINNDESIEKFYILTNIKKYNFINNIFNHYYNINSNIIDYNINNNIIDYNNLEYNINNNLSLNEQKLIINEIYKLNNIILNNSILNNSLNKTILNKTILNDSKSFIILTLILENDIFYNISKIIILIIVALLGILDSIYITYLIPIMNEIVILIKQKKFSLNKKYNNISSNILYNDIVGYYHILISIPFIIGPIISSILFEKFNNYIYSYLLGGIFSIIGYIILELYSHIK